MVSAELNKRKWKWSQPAQRCARGKWPHQKGKVGFFGWAQPFPGHFCPVTEAKGKKRPNLKPVSATELYSISLSNLVIASKNNATHSTERVTEYSC